MTMRILTPPVPQRSAQFAQEAIDVYFTPSKATPTPSLRCYSALDLMYGYYIAE